MMWFFSVSLLPNSDQSEVCVCGRVAWERFPFEEGTIQLLSNSCSSEGRTGGACESAQHIWGTVPGGNLGFRELPAFLLLGNSLPPENHLILIAFYTLTSLITVTDVLVLL